MRPLLWLLLIFGAVSTSLHAQYFQSTYQLSVDDCLNSAPICAEIDEATYATVQIYIDDVEVTSPRVSCNEDTLLSYRASELGDDGLNGPYDIIRWEVNGQGVSGTFNSPAELAIIMRFADPSGNWTYDAAREIIVGGNLSQTYTDLDVFCQPLIEDFTAVTRTILENGGSAFEFQTGNHTIEARQGANVLETASVNVACTASPVYTYVELNIPNSTLVCPDLGLLAGPVSEVSFSPTPTVVSINLTTNDCFEVTPTGVGVDSVAIRYCDASDNCAIAYYVFDSELGTPIVSSTVLDTVTAPGSVVTYCVDTLELPGVVVSVENVCPAASGTFVDMDLQEESVCVKYRGLVSGGTDTACIVVCDNFGFCDTTTLIVTTIEPNEYPDQNLEFTIEEGTASSTVLDLSSFTDPIASITNSCDNLSGTAVAFVIQNSNNSVDFSGLLPGQERACIDVVDDSGRTQRINITVTVLARAPGNDTIRIRNGNSRFWCFGPFELSGPPVDMFDECPSSSPNARIENTNDITCFNFVAEAVGTQKVCVTLCDNDGVCDRIDLIIQVLPNDDDRLPRAEDDFYSIDASNPQPLAVLDNDSNVDALNFLQVIRAPRFGSASFSGSEIINYIPNAGHCGSDTLTYEICNSFGCDQAQVIVVSDCDGTAQKPAIINRSGFSPNGDGVNDTWILSNIESYPTSNVKVYSRWGVRVLEVNAYQNDWDATFDGDILPDGTYFFIVDLGEDGLDPVSGYVHVRR